MKKGEKKAATFGMGVHTVWTNHFDRSGSVLQLQG